MKKLAAALLIFALCFSLLAGCGKKETTFSGTVTNASESLVTVEGVGGVHTFSIGNSTVVEGRESGAIIVGDGVTVEFSGKLKDSPAAMKVTITTPMPEPEPEPEPEDEGAIFKGTVLESLANKLTVQSDSGAVAVTFMVDASTVITGVLTIGDEVEVTFTGDIVGLPVASAIKVVTDKDDVSKYSVSGTASDVTATSVTVNVNSAHSYIFVTNNSTKISGKATKVGVGDSIKITYTGPLSGSPTAEIIEVTKVATGTVVSKTSGVVTSVASNGFSVNTGSGIYAFVTNSSTKFTGLSIAVNNNIVVTYTGALSGSPVATEVYCTAPTPPPAPAPTPPQPAPNPMSSGAGTVADYSYYSISIYTDNGGYVTLGIMDDTNISSGIEEGDYVSFEYNTSTMQAASVYLLYAGGGEDDYEG